MGGETTLRRTRLHERPFRETAHDYADLVHLKQIFVHSDRQTGIRSGPRSSDLNGPDMEGERLAGPSLPDCQSPSLNIVSGEHISLRATPTKIALYLLTGY